ncbi:MAG TPA: hypothetical protein PLA49_13345 [Propioniciclava sp.]|nr:hypothetical protein [Propioniciclava sp.]
MLYSVDRPAGDRDHVRVLGLFKNKRTYRWIPRAYLDGPESFDSFKVAVPVSRNAGGMLGELPALVTGQSLLLEPGVGVTQTFITIGSFDFRADAERCLKYVQSKFARVMLGILKVTQHNPRSTWKYVPNQDFSDDSDIDWSRPIPEIDQQLYARYELDANEIAFIETKVKPME